jgi:hypothetical protein
MLPARQYQALTREYVAEMSVVSQDVSSPFDEQFRVVIVSAALVLEGVLNVLSVVPIVPDC